MMILQPVWIALVPACALLVGTLWAVVARWSTGVWSERSVELSRCVVALLVLGIALRPTAMREVEVPVPSPVDVVVLLDRTASMGAKDGTGDSPDRIGSAGKDLVELVAASGGANVTVIVFDDEARVAVPSTTDLNAVETFLTTLGWRPSAKATGSDISVALPVAAAALEAAVRDRPDNQRFVVYAGDGEQTLEAVPASFAELAPAIDGAMVLGYGDRDGAPIPIAPDSDETVEIDGEEQLSVPDFDALRAIAEDLGGEFVDRSADAPLPELTSGEQVTRVELLPGEEYHWWLALASVPFLVHLLVASLMGARRAREELR